MYYDFYYGYCPRIIYTWEHHSTNDLYYEMILHIKDYRMIAAMEENIKTNSTYRGKNVANARAQSEELRNNIEKTKKRIGLKIVGKTRKINLPG